MGSRKIDYNVMRYPICWLILGGLWIAALAPANSATGATKMNGFDLDGALVPVDEIRSGGPPRDGIPSIDRPKFVEPAAARYLRPDDLVVSVAVGSETRAYPLRILVWHEIVNDTIGDKPIAVTYCPLCGTAMVFDRRYGERVLTFGVSGLLYQSDVLMYDRETESLWSQLGLKSVAGRFKGRTLTWLPSEHMTWQAWREKYPEGRVLSTETGHRRDYGRTPYDGYEATERTLFPVPRNRSDLRNKEWIAGVIVDGTSKAYRLRSMPKGEWLDDSIGDVPVRVLYDPATRDFRAENRETGDLIPSVQAYWFAWQAFYPETALWN